MTAFVIADKEVDYEGWLAARRKLVTASESAHLLNLTDEQWRLSEEELAEQKRAGAEKEVSARMEAGTFWEPSIHHYFEALTGWPGSPETALWGNPARPSMGASPDGFLEGIPESPTLGRGSEYLTVVARGTVYQGREALGELLSLAADYGFRAVLEIKNQESKQRSKWNKPAGPPRYYENQVRHQMAVLDDYKLGILAARVDANELYVHCIEWDDVWEPLLVDACTEFWEKYLI